MAVNVSRAGPSPGRCPPGLHGKTRVLARHDTCVRVGMMPGVHPDAEWKDSLMRLRRTVREGIAAGLLPLARLASAVRRGSGHPCFICAQSILPSELEREVHAGRREDRPVTVHEPCYLLWRVESMSSASKTAQPEATS